MNKENADILPELLAAARAEQGFESARVAPMSAEGERSAPFLSLSFIESAHIYRDTKRGGWGFNLVFSEKAQALGAPGCLGTPTEMPVKSRDEAFSVGVGLVKALMTQDQDAAKLSAIN